MTDIGIIAESWIGTPYRYGGAHKQKGVDCVRFITSVFKEAGILRKGYQPPKQHRDWMFGKKIDKDYFKNELLKFCNIENITDRKEDDVISFFYDGVESHLGIIVEDDNVIHAPSGRKVMKHPFKMLKTKAVNIYRAKNV